MFYWKQGSISFECESPWRAFGWTCVASISQLWHSISNICENMNSTHGLYQPIVYHIGNKHIKLKGKREKEKIRTPLLASSIVQTQHMGIWFMFKHFWKWRGTIIYYNKCTPGVNTTTKGERERKIMFTISKCHVVQHATQ